jgi:hypothetical protein
MARVVISRHYEQMYLRTFFPDATNPIQTNPKHDHINKLG